MALKHVSIKVSAIEHRLVRVEVHLVSGARPEKLLLFAAGKRTLIAPALWQNSRSLSLLELIRLRRPNFFESLAEVLTEHKLMRHIRSLRANDIEFMGVWLLIQLLMVSSRNRVFSRNDITLLAAVICGRILRRLLFNNGRELKSGVILAALVDEGLLRRVSWGKTEAGKSCRFILSDEAGFFFLGQHLITGKVINGQNWEVFKILRVVKGVLRLLSHHLNASTASPEVPIRVLQFLLTLVNVIPLFLLARSILAGLWFVLVMWVYLLDLGPLLSGLSRLRCWYAVQRKLHKRLVCQMWVHLSHSQFLIKVLMARFLTLEHCEWWSMVKLVSEMLHAFQR